MTLALFLQRLALPAALLALGACATTTPPAGSAAAQKPQAQTPERPARSAPSQATASVVVSDDQAQAGHSVDLRVGQELVVRLAGNPSSGFRWRLIDVLETAPLQTAGPPVLETGATSTAMPGASGTEVWRFRAGQPGPQTLRFEYRRVWEIHVEALRSLDLDVVVQADAPSTAK